jgi:predicted RNase H-like HicB family nuclease
LINYFELEMKYEIIIFWSDDDKCFVADMPELKGCTANGEIYNEALSQV